METGLLKNQGRDEVNPEHRKVLRWELEALLSRQGTQNVKDNLLPSLAKAD